MGLERWIWAIMAFRAWVKGEGGGEGFGGSVLRLQTRGGVGCAKGRCEDGGGFVVVGRGLIFDSGSGCGFALASGRDVVCGWAVSAEGALGGA